MVEVVRIMLTCFQRSHTGTAALNAPDPSSGHHQPTPLPKTPRHSQASLSQSLVWTLLFFPGSWCTQGFVCALRESVSAVLCKVWMLYGGVNGNLFHEGLCHIQVCCTQSPCPCCRLLLTRTSAGGHSDTLLPQSLWTLWVLVHTRFVWALCVSLVGMGFDSKHDSAPPTILLGLLLCPWTWGIFFWYDSAFFCRRLFRSEL